MKFFEGDIETDSLFSVNNAGNVILINKRRASITNDQSRNFNPLFQSFNIYWNTPPQSLRLEKYYLVRHALRDRSFYLVGNDSITKYSKSGVLESTRIPSPQDPIQFFVYKKKLYNLNKLGQLSFLENDTFVPVQLNQEIGPNARIYNNSIAGQVFLYANKQLFLLSFKKNHIASRLILENFDLDKEEIYTIHYNEKNEIIYLGSLTRGLCIVKKQYFENISTRTKTKDNVEYSVNKLNDSTIITGKGSIIEKRKPVGQYKKIIENSLGYIAQLDTSLNLWVSKEQSLSKYYANTAYYSCDSIHFKEKIRSALIDGNDLWIGTGAKKRKNAQGELFLINLSNPGIAVPKSILHTPQMITSLVKFNDTLVFCGTQQGLYKYDQKNDRLSKIRGLEKMHIRSMYQSKNSLWITTYEDGFFLYKDAKIWSFPLDENRYLATAHCIIEDDNGFFWITTNKGLFQVLKKNLMDYLEDKNTPIYYHYYDKASGFSSNEFNGGGSPCGIQLSNQDIVLPSLDGLVYFNPLLVHPKVPDDNIYIDEIIVDGERRFIKESLTLENAGRITFQISSPFYGNPYNHQIEIQVDDGEWEPTSVSNSLSFTNLAPGKHVIKARKLAGFSSGYRYADIEFFVVPTFWQSTFFKVLFIFLLGFLTYLTVVLRTRYILKKNVQLKQKINEHTLQLQQTIHILREAKGELKSQVSKQKKLVTAITHDIKTPLRFLAHTSKHSFENLEKQGPSKSLDSAKAIHTSSYQLFHFIENVLDYSFITLDNGKLDKVNFSLFDLIQEKIGFFENITSSKKISIVNKIPNELTLSFNKQLFSIIIHNLLDNSTKNTYEGEIVFWQQQVGESFILHIEDTGSGMSTETQARINSLKESIANGTYEHRHRQTGFGLTIVMELLMMLDADISIESQLGKGTQVSISF